MIKGDWIDAYAHVGSPRFGTLEQAVRSMKLWGVAKSVLVLGPLVPDYQTLFAAMRRYPDMVRGIGIPFGETEGQRRELAELALRGGVAGLRMDRGEVLGNPRIADLLGEYGRWLYVPGNGPDPELCERLSSWLERYPLGRIAAPHFLKAGEESVRELLEPKARALVSHPRFHPIFSRHGGMGSRQPYPHRDYLPWIRQVVRLKGWDGILWGSEYPVLYWRGETMETVRQWIGELDPGLSADELVAFTHGNAERLFFAEPAPDAESVNLPEWVERQFEKKRRTVPLLPDRPFELPMPLYEKLWDDYLRSDLYGQGRSFEQYLVGRLEDCQELGRENRRFRGNAE